jgi:AAA15 family ATPase/GTPase
MIISFSIKNFRSIKENFFFSMEASSSETKINNIAIISLASGEELRLTKTAAIYGPNASGKSNVIRAFFNLHKFITNSKDIEFDQNIQYYEPFLFDKSSTLEPTEFELFFVGQDNHKYRYFIVFNQDRIIEETLDWYPKKKKQNLFAHDSDKINADSNLNTVKLSKNLNYKSYEIYKKIPFLSIFKKADNYHAVLSPIYTYFNTLEIWNVLDSFKIAIHKQGIIDELHAPANAQRKLKLNQLIKFTDTKIEKINILYSNEQGQNRLSRNQLYATHKVFENNENVGEYDLPFHQESAGTNTLFMLGALIFKALEKGSTIIFDEIDTSLHPILTSTLIQLFHSPISNPNNAQIIYTTHETYLLDKHFLRSDQIWFADKNELGETDIYSAQDFKGIREDISFEKWYLAGKFNAIPNIEDLEDIFKHG